MYFGVFSPKTKMHSAITQLIIEFSYFLTAMIVVIHINELIITL